MFEDFTFTFTFSARPVAIPPDLRASWKIGLIILILHMSCRATKASVGKLHILNSMLVSDEIRDVVVDVIRGKPPLFPIAVRVEPAINRAVDLAAGMGLVKATTKGRIALSAEGKKLARILDATQIYEHEKQVLKRVGKSLSEELVLQLKRGAE